MTTTAWAVTNLDKTYINTISDTRRAAIVNWLVTEKQMMVYTSHTDADIEAMWNHLGRYVEVRQVEIRPLTN